MKVRGRNHNARATRCGADTAAERKRYYRIVMRSLGIQDGDLCVYWAICRDGSLRTTTLTAESDDAKHFDEHRWCPKKNTPKFATVRNYVKQCAEERRKLKKDHLDDGDLAMLSRFIEVKANVRVHDDDRKYTPQKRKAASDIGSGRDKLLPVRRFPNYYSNEDNETITQDDDGDTPIDTTLNTPPNLDRGDLPFNAAPAPLPEPAAGNASTLEWAGQHATPPEAPAVHASTLKPSAEHAPTPEPHVQHATALKPSAEHAPTPEPPDEHASTPEPTANHAMLDVPESAAGMCGRASTIIGFMRRGCRDQLPCLQQELEKAKEKRAHAQKVSDSFHGQIDSACMRGVILRRL